MEQYEKFVSDMFPEIRRSLEHKYNNSYDLNAAAMDEVYKLWEVEEKIYLPRVFGIKLSQSQQKNAGILDSDNPVIDLVLFLEKEQAPSVIRVDSDKDFIYLTVDDPENGDILKDWVQYRLRGRASVIWHYLRE